MEAGRMNNVYQSDLKMVKFCFLSLFWSQDRALHSDFHLSVALTQTFLGWHKGGLVKKSSWWGSKKRSSCTNPLYRVSKSWWLQLPWLQTAPENQQHQLDAMPTFSTQGRVQQVTLFHNITQAFCLFSFLFITTSPELLFPILLPVSPPTSSLPHPKTVAYLQNWVLVNS